MRRRLKGFFITLEGPEGSGKSSQAGFLAHDLRSAGYRAVQLRDPGSTSVGCRLRRILLHSRAELSALTEALLFIGTRAQLVNEHIRPALSKGKIVVCDRFHDATVVYQGIAGGVDASWLDRYGRSAIDNIMPDLTILLDVQTARGFARLRHPKDRMERKTAGFHRRVRRGYLDRARREPQRFVVVDASQTPERLRAQIGALVIERIKRSNRQRETSGRRQLGTKP